MRTAERKQAVPTRDMRCKNYSREQGKGFQNLGSRTCLARTRASGRTGQPVIADNLSKAGWSWGCVATVDSNGRTIFIADAHRDDGKRFVVHADEKLTAFVELESAIRA
jgi:hypothetical protein